MGVKPHPKWAGWYVLDIRHGKKDRDRINFEGSYEDAQKEYWRLKGKDAKIVGRKTTIGELLGEFLTWYRLEHSEGTVKDFLFAWKRLEPHFSRLHFHHIDSTEIDRYKAKRLGDRYLPGKHKEVLTEEDQGRLKPVSKRTITRELAYLSSFCKWAKEKGYTNHEPRIKGFPKKQTRAPIQSTHSFEEVQRVIDQVTESRNHGADRYGLTLLMYDAGLRKKEARLLTAERTDLPPEPIILDADTPPYYGSITVIRKGGKEERLPILTERLYLELKERKKKRGRGYLYINPRTLKPYCSILSGLKSAAERAGVTKRMTNHLLRHDFATHLHQGGADLKSIQGLLGHSEISTTMNIYTHLEHAELARNAGAFAKKVDKHAKSDRGGQKNIREDKD